MLLREPLDFLICKLVLDFQSMNLYLSLQVPLELIVLLIALIQLSNDGYLDSVEGGRIF